MSAEVRALLALAVIALLGWLGYGYLFGDNAEATIRLADIAGDVAIERGGTRSPASEGATLSATDRLTAGKNGGATLELGEGNRVAVGPDTSLTVTSVTEEGVGIALEGGRVKATIRPDGPALDLTARGKRIEADDADFDVVVEGETVGVTTTRGVLTAEGQRLAAQQRLLMGEGKPLQLPVSEQLLLEMAWPADPRTPRPTLSVAGETEPGARVTVWIGTVEAAALAGRDGRFSVDVPLGEGVNEVRVSAINVFGQVTEANWAVTRDSTPPTIGVEVQ